MSGQQLGLNIQASRKKQVAAETIHDLNDKKVSELTKEEALQFREDWAVHFNDLDFRDGRFKVVPKGGTPLRFHDKVDAIKSFYGQDVATNLFEGKKVLMTREK